MTVYFEPRDYNRYSFYNYTPMLLAQMGAQLLGDEFKAMRNRALNYKQIQAAQKAGQDPTLLGMIQDPYARQKWIMETNPNYLRASKEAQARMSNVFNFDKYSLAAGSGTQAIPGTTQAVEQAVRQGIAQNGNIANAAAVTESPMTKAYMEGETNTEPYTQTTTATQTPTSGSGTTQSIVGKGLRPGDNSIAYASLYGTAAGIDPNVMKQVLGIMAPQTKTGNVDSGGNVLLYQTTDYTPGYKAVGNIAKSISPDTQATLDNAIKVENMRNAAGIKEAQIRAGATLGAASIGQSGVKQDRVLYAIQSEMAKNNEAMSNMLNKDDPVYKQLKARNEFLGDAYNRILAPLIPGGIVTQASVNTGSVKKELPKNTYKPQKGKGTDYLNDAEKKYNNKK